MAFLNMLGIYMKVVRFTTNVAKLEYVCTYEAHFKVSVICQYFYIEKSVEFLFWYNEIEWIIIFCDFLINNGEKDP